MTPALERRALQLAVALGGFVPVGAGLAGVLLGVGMVPGEGGGVSLDSHLRYLSGLLLGLGLAFWAAIPRLERHGGRFRLLTLLVVIGGLGRALGYVLNGVPSGGMAFGLGMELVVTPLLCLWQARVARRLGAG